MTVIEEPKSVVRWGNEVHRQPQGKQFADRAIHGPGGRVTSAAVLRLHGGFEQPLCGVSTVSICRMAPLRYAPDGCTPGRGRRGTAWQILSGIE